MKLAKINTNDFEHGEGVCVSLFIQGCPHHCLGCHSPETWDFSGGQELPTDIRGQIIKAISANGITRNFSILGGEPLCLENLEEVDHIITAVRTAYPHIKIFVWTGYTLEELQKTDDLHLINILSKIDVLIDGPYDSAQEDSTLELKRSKNQRVLYHGVDF